MAVTTGKKPYCIAGMGDRMQTRVTPPMSVHLSSGGPDSALEIPCPGEDAEQAHDSCLAGGEIEATSSMCLLRAEHLFLGAEKLGWTSHR